MAGIASSALFFGNENGGECLAGQDQRARGEGSRGYSSGPARPRVRFKFNAVWEPLRCHLSGST